MRQNGQSLNRGDDSIEFVFVPYLRYDNGFHEACALRLMTKIKSVPLHRIVCHKLSSAQRTR